MTHEVEPDTEAEVLDDLPDAASIPSEPLQDVPVGDLDANEEFVAMLQHDAENGG